MNKTPYQQFVENNGGGPAFREPTPSKPSFICTVQADTPDELKAAVVAEIARRVAKLRAEAWMQTTVRAKAAHDARINELDTLRIFLEHNVVVEPKETV